MSAIVCSLSGSPTTEAVVSLKTGHIYQKSTITKHIRAYGTCPHTRQPMTLSDLLPLAVSAGQTVVNVAYTDVDKIMEKIEKQYQAMVLQAHFLKKQLQESRQQLAQSLYRQDASIRVIAKLNQQIDANRGQIAKLVQSGGQAAQGN